VARINPVYRIREERESDWGGLIGGVLGSTLGASLASGMLGFAFGGPIGAAAGAAAGAAENAASPSAFSLSPAKLAGSAGTSAGGALGGAVGSGAAHALFGTPRTTESVEIDPQATAQQHLGELRDRWRKDRQSALAVMLPRRNLWA